MQSEQTSLCMQSENIMNKSLCMQSEQTSLCMQSEQTSLCMQSEQTSLCMQSEQTSLCMQSEQTSLFGVSMAIPGHRGGRGPSQHTKRIQLSYVM